MSLTELYRQRDALIRQYMTPFEADEWVLRIVHWQWGECEVQKVQQRHIRTCSFVHGNQFACLEHLADEDQDLVED